MRFFESDNPKKSEIKNSEFLYEMFNFEYQIVSSNIIDQLMNNEMVSD